MKNYPIRTADRTETLYRFRGDYFIFDLFFEARAPHAVRSTAGVYVRTLMCGGARLTGVDGGGGVQARRRRRRRL